MATNRPPNLIGNVPGKEVRRHVKISDKKATITEKIALALSWILVLIFFPFSFCCLLKVNEFQRAVIFRLGRLRKRARGPGLVWFLPCIDDPFIIDLRTRVAEIPKQEVITLDSVAIKIDGVLFYYVENALHMQIQIANVHDATVFIAQTNLRTMVGAMTLNDLLTSRTTLSERIALALEKTSESWGIKVVRVEIKDIVLPESLQRALAIEAEAMRGARAKIISAQGELDASRAMKEASDTMAKNSLTLQLRHLQNIVAISQKHHLEIYFPIPLDLVDVYGKVGSSGFDKGPSKPDTSPSDRDRVPFPSGLGRISDFSANVIQTVVGRLSTVSTYLQGLAEDYGNDRMPDPFDLESNTDVRLRSADHTHRRITDFKKSSRGTQTERHQFI